ncbi:MAG: NUDIX hydrolase, partial [Ardenticatenaceae bacterium]
MKPKQLSRTVIYESPWVNLYVDQVRFPSGDVVDDYHIVDFKKDAVVVLVENEQQEVLFVHSYRYATDSLEWELPAGLIEAGEDPLETAQREVLEESGYQTT